MNKNEDELIKQSIRYQSAITESLHLIGNKIAKKYSYKKLSGIDAVQYYLVQKYRWLPSQVKSMTFEDIYFCFEEDIMALW